MRARLPSSKERSYALPAYGGTLFYKLRRSQMRTVLSHEPEATNLPSGEIETEYTQSECPSSVAVQAPEVRSQMRTVLSNEPEATNLPSGEMDTDVTLLVLECPSSVAVQAPEVRSQM